MRALSCLVAVVNSLVDWSIQVAPSLPMVAAGGRLISVSPTRTEAVKLSESGKPVVSAESFLEAIVPTNQSNPVLVDKRPLATVTLLHSRNASSATNLTSADQGAEEIATRKQQLRQFIKLFNTKPNKGMKAILEGGFCENNPSAAAAFLLSTPGLDKSALGDFLGDIEPFNLKVMHAFIDSMSFKNTAFVTALRGLLQTFRLPGEAQKIDRIMEKFADRYWFVFCNASETNPDVFAKADTAYTLAYSVIMLNTDQHSSKIRHRMDKAAFIKNNRGINDNANLPDEYLGAIFDEISGNEIVMEEEQAGQFAALAVGWGAGDLDNDRTRMELYRKEIALIQKKSQQLIKAAGKSTPTTAQHQMVFRSAVNADLARPMFAMASWAMMATFSLASFLLILAF